VLGNPDLDDPRYDLPSAESEAQGHRADGAGSVLPVREEATKSSFKQLASDFPILHVASHGNSTPARR
jgi:CHAT domain-containing protein